jgi:hypothetical protein
VNETSTPNSAAAPAGFLVDIAAADESKSIHGQIFRASEETTARPSRRNTGR